MFPVDRARASFKTKFGSMGLRDRGLRLAGYLTPPSDVTQEEEEANEWYNRICIFIFSSGCYCLQTLKK